ncbi:MAG TPA: recombinase family protein, partial [Deinococcales bacterium]|nr:recombinase family protein [Deinococcales bacterium]
MAGVAAYIRVSTDRQARDDRYGYARQEAEIRAYVERAGLPPLAGTFQDAISGTRERRGGFDDLLNAGPRGAGLYDLVVYSEVDRLGRNTLTAFSLLLELLKAGYQVHSAYDGRFDPADLRSRRQFAER